MSARVPLNPLPAAYLSLGSNLDPERNLRSAAAALRERFGDVVFSTVLRTPPVGFDGPEFLNAAAIVRTDLDPYAFVAWLHGLESRQGRDRSGPRFSSRTLDIDIVFYDDLVIVPAPSSHLQLPRPELQHAFVLQPLAQIAPDLRDPLSGRTLAQLWAAHPQHATPLPVATGIGAL
ncbi:MAG TPA: 2-amino-4-hydroxy-6-hydroxymethyldihydropteridine diphosphokinase [Xanthomonadaceae bacterium]|jgi:2-amino-4-hydroxy-6-hydroxymethyldihydropteridine diphosphokinase|nr:2-amino-4-hydroxy-6-hydroxymethyldihydropteridine diphosphokinase [Xanthomonadaceae bacterium]